MAIEQEVTPDVASVNPPADTPPIEAAPAPTDTPPPGDGAPPAPVEPVYQPNFDFKVYDKDYQIPEKFRPLIKDKETEKEIKEIMEKAYGLDHVKPIRDSLRAENATLKERIDATDRGLARVDEYLAKGDFDSFLEVFGIAPEKILRYAVEYAQRTPEQQAALQASRQRDTQISQYDEGYRRLAAENESLATKMREFELMQAISQPEISPLAQAYNAAQENPHAFQEFVIRIGQSYAAQGQDISVQQAVTEAMRYLKGLQPAAPAQTASQPPVNPNGVVQKPSRETLPNIQGGNVTPVKSKVKSLDDLYKLRSERGISDAITPE